MLFNSYVFIGLFLLPTVAMFFWLRPAHRFGFLIAASVLFYAQWNTLHLLLLLVSVVMNYLLSLWLMKQRYRKTLLLLGIVLNLLPLLYFKYAFFLHLTARQQVLPLAISFYTFQQIAFLTDLYKGKVKAGSFGEYLFFVLFFPQLVAGPIVHYSEIIPQVQKGALRTIAWDKVQAGTLLFSLGIFKKVVLADSLFPFADHAFGNVSALNSMDAWSGVLAYTLGIYFDFSGYTDMAIGLALLFGIRLPVNFNSPYKAVDIVDFWRRWHITLSRFLRDYVYIPLGGNRRGERREVRNLVLTMILGGIWHGAGWTFLFWGLAHGLLLAAVHIKKRYLHRRKLPKMAAVGVTFAAVSLLWVLFRARNMAEAWQYYHVLFAFDTGVPQTDALFFVAAGLGIVWFLPNSMVFTGYTDVPKTGKAYAAVAALLLFVSLKMMAEAPAQTFVYFNF